MGVLCFFHKPFTFFFALYNDIFRVRNDVYANFVVIYWVLIKVLRKWYTRIGYLHITSIYSCVVCVWSSHFVKYEFIEEFFNNETTMHDIKDVNGIQFSQKTSATVDKLVTCLSVRRLYIWLHITYLQHLTKRIMSFHMKVYVEHFHSHNKYQLQ